MPGVDPTWDKPQDTQFCAECERLAKENAALKELVREMGKKLDYCQERLAVAEKLIRKGESYLLSHCLGYEGVDLGKEMQSFRTPTPEPTPESSNPPSNNWSTQKP